MDEKPSNTRREARRTLKMITGLAHTSDLKVRAFLKKGNTYTGLIIEFGEPIDIDLEKVNVVDAK